MVARVGWQGTTKSAGALCLARAGLRGLHNMPGDILTTRVRVESLSYGTTSHATRSATHSSRTEGNGPDGRKCDVEICHAKRLFTNDRCSLFLARIHPAVCGIHGCRQIHRSTTLSVGCEKRKKKFGTG